MKKLGKVLVISILALALCFGFAACDKDKPTDKPTIDNQWEIIWQYAQTHGTSTGTSRRLTFTNSSNDLCILDVSSHKGMQFELNSVGTAFIIKVTLNYAAINTVDNTNTFSFTATQQYSTWADNAFGVGEAFAYDEIIYVSHTVISNTFTLITDFTIFIKVALSNLQAFLRETVGAKLFI